MKTSGQSDGQADNTAKDLSARSYEKIYILNTSVVRVNSQDHQEKHYFAPISSSVID